MLYYPQRILLLSAAHSVPPVPLTTLRSTPGRPYNADGNIVDPVSDQVPPARSAVEGGEMSPLRL